MPEGSEFSDEDHSICPCEIGQNSLDGIEGFDGHYDPCNFLFQNFLALEDIFWGVAVVVVDSLFCTAFAGNFLFDQCLALVPSSYDVDNPLGSGNILDPGNSLRIGHHIPDDPTLTFLDFGSNRGLHIVLGTLYIQTNSDRLLLGLRSNSLPSADYIDAVGLVASKTVFLARLGRSLLDNL